LHRAGDSSWLGTAKSFVLTDDISIGSLVTCAAVSILPALRRPAIAALVAASTALALAACGNSEDTPTAKGSGTSSGEQTTMRPVETKFSLEPGAVRGYVDSARVEGEAVVLTGWAGSSNLSAAAQQVVGKVADETVAEAVPAVERRDVADFYEKPGLKQSGFELRVPISALKCSAPAGDLKVFGILDGSGSELPLVEGTKGELSEAC
jgi:hypothetical protein